MPRSTTKSVGKLLRTALFVLIVLLLCVLIVFLLTRNKVGTEPEAVNHSNTGNLTYSCPSWKAMRAGDPNKPTAKASINDMIAAASPGDTVIVPGGQVYRELVFIWKPLTLIAKPGAEIRGSEVFTFDGKTSNEIVPELYVSERWAGTTKFPSSEKAMMPEQVFVDGQPYEQVGANPGPGEFALNAERHVVLADDPGQAVVEVTVREIWVKGESDDVIIQGFAMRHSANIGLDSGKHNNWEVRCSDLAYAHTVNLKMTQADGLVADGNRIHHAGQMNFGANNSKIELTNNEISYGNMEGFALSWEAGGMKLAQVRYALVEGNNVHHNNGNGIWTDVSASEQEIIIRGNRTHHNLRHGIRVEMNKNALVENNISYYNGWTGFATNASYNVTMRGNVSYRDNRGIQIENTNRGKGHDITENVLLEGNTIIDPDSEAVAWYRSFDEGNIYDPKSNNHGKDNRYWYPEPEGDKIRFVWEDPYTTLSAYLNSGVESGSRYLSDKEKDAVLAEHDLD